MKIALGLFLVVLGVAAGIYFGLWWAFIGGIVGVVKQLQATHIQPTILALDILRIIVAAPFGWGCGIICVIPGLLTLGRALR